jgi:hypothetical protein
MIGVYRSMASLSLAVAVARAIDTYESLDSSLQSEQISGARWERPPAGWNAWFAYDKSVTQEGILRNAEALVRTGLRDAGCAFGLPCTRLSACVLVPACCRPVQPTVDTVLLTRPATAGTTGTTCRHVCQRRRCLGGAACTRRHTDG